MPATEFYVVHADTYEVWCYGTLEENSNFSVMCEDEEDDDIWFEGNLTTGEPFATWEEAVKHMQGYFESAIIEVTAI